MHGVFARLGFEHGTVHADKVTEVDHLHDFIVFFAHFVTSDHHLQAAITVLEVHKTHFALTVEANHTASESNTFARSHQSVLIFFQNLGIMRAVELVRISLHTHFLELFKLREACLNLVIHILHCHNLVLVNFTAVNVEKKEASAVCVEGLGGV